jgi:hypothetical protein
VQKLAKSDPAAFGTSIVFTGTKESRLNKDGTAQKDQDGNELPPLVRVEHLHAVDVVDDPAANEGLFAVQFMTPDCECSARMTQFLDKFLSRPEAVDKLIAFFMRYGSNSQPKGEGGPQMGETQKKTNETKETLSAAPAADPPAAPPAAPPASPPAPDNDPVQAERQRVTAILSHCEPGQEAIAKKAIAEGLSMSETLALLLADERGKRAAKLAELRKDPLPKVGPGGDDVPKVEATHGVWNEALEAAAKLEFGNKPEVQKEFKTAEAYVAYAKSVALGHHKEPEAK